MKEKKKKKLRLRRITTQTKSDGTTTILNEDVVSDARVVSIYLKAKVSRLDHSHHSHHCSAMQNMRIVTFGLGTG